MDISVLVPIYGVENYVEQSLRSLFCQTKTAGVEFILVNDCTKDNSMSIVRRVISEFSNLTIKVIEHEENKGVAVARQTALDVAVGKYVQFCDSDDWLEPTMLEDMYNCATVNDADVVVCDFYVNHPKKIIYISQSKEDIEQDCVGALLNGKMHPFLLNKIIKRAIFIENRIKFIPGINMGEDFFCLLKVFNFANTVKYLPNAYYYYRQYAASMCNNWSLKTSTELINLEEQTYNFLEQQQNIDIYRVEYDYRRITIQHTLVYETRGEEQKKYATLYPEVTTLISSHPTLPFHYKFALTNARAGRIWISNLIYSVINLGKKILR